jgi:hypothetical protein
VADANRQRTLMSLVPLACFVLAVLAVVIVYFSVSGTPMYRLSVIIGYVVLILLFFFGLMVVVAIVTGKIDLSLLLSESGGGASMSRFQLLIFTFVIAFSLFMMTVSSMKFPTIPAEILTLLGISASTYAVSKGIQASNPALEKTDKPKTTTTVEEEARVQTTTTGEKPK